MAIIVVSEIPKPNRPQKVEPFDYRGKVKTDLIYAWNEHLPKFEFVGYNSNATAAQYARDEAHKLFDSKIYRSARSNAEERLKVELKGKLGKAVKYIRVPYCTTAEPAIKITGVTVNGAKRIFGEIDWDYIDSLETTLFDRYMKKYSDKETIAELKEKWAREKSNMSKKRGK